VVGHTGSGKSTLAQHLNLLLTPKSGKIEIDGKTAVPGSSGARELRRKVGLVFQYPETQFFAETVREEIGFAPSNWGLKKDELEDCVRAAAAAAGLTPEVLESNPFRLSGGQRRRVAIASVIAMKPDYLVLDEPTAGLDAAGVRDLTRMLNEIRAGGLAVVQVTHDLKSALEHSDMMLVLEKGREIYAGTPEETASYLAEHPVKGLVLPPLVRFAGRMRQSGFDIPIISGIPAMLGALSEGARRI
jgi:energy-coupling factor transport system ATP-binding protein